MSIWQFEPFTYDTRSGELSARNQSAVVLRHKVAQLISYLIEHRERPVSKEELLDKLWQHGDYRERSLTQSIRELRQALGDNATNPEFIRTLPGRGYQWIANVSPVREAQTQAKAKRTIPMVAVAALCTVIFGVALWWYQSTPKENSNPSSTTSLIVLPFTNHTGDAALDWLQLGYADMLAKTLARTGRVQITPPSTAAELLAGAGLDWPTLPVYIQSLLQEQGTDAALIASVRLHKQTQVIDFQVLNRSGKVQQGSLTYPSLTDATAEVAGQLLQLIAPDSGNIVPKLTLAGDSPEIALARRVLAEGISALQTDGPARADELFQAADLLVKGDPWITACRAKSELLKGQWQSARERLQDLRAQPNQAPLKAFVEFWSAQLAFREGRVDSADAHLEVAINQALDSHTIDILADAYHLKAEIAWLQQRWSDYQHWRDLASQVLPNNDDMAVEANRLLYLGNPVGEGLERPEISAQQQQARIKQLKRALAFYQALGNKPQTATSHLALARNYTLALEQREQHLNRALALFKTLGQPYELAEAQIYAAFFYLQEHRGQEAFDVITQAQATTAPLENYRNQHTLTFYRAFALLDQGLDQSHRGLHTGNAQILEQAVETFDTLLQAPVTSMLRAQALVLQGWGFADLKRHSQALTNYREAMTLSESTNLTATFGYAVYSAMHSHLMLGNYDAVIALGDEPVYTRQQLAYLARANYELGDFKAATNTLATMKRDFADLWSKTDEKRLRQYGQADAASARVTLSAELPAHGIYCESDWLVAMNEP
ncbi:winged helix-turn-helix domain-containing protein [Gilvimarinus sp. SDUM040013]|uniref:Winged helix-turn-helix domain-containing protein n=1 Tax=Gilvimarinus gilvus TaxID=3058038 RepID=A0ABU4RZB3_9GAMM|nr:winged helix-turn-helix domain-containing protein [Gilvimarinus sp. SDUM040013]MDO3384654.1 winged helix-turn-helix domain-containing protein [Gilvimarinus sp. SDUM040013]MDX6850240.1 winged helix-turn-helix domain-containing protein [Gilvimarinus sp. SDUM040013]